MKRPIAQPKVPPRSMVMLINIQVLGPAARSLRKQVASK